MHLAGRLHCRWVTQFFLMLRFILIFPSDDYRRDLDKARGEEIVLQIVPRSLNFSLENYLLGD